MTSIEQTQHLDEIDRMFRENADYYASGDLAKARAFITAVTLMMARPESATLGGSGGESVRYNLAVLKTLIDDARKWLTFHEQSRNQITYEDFRNYRD